MTKFITPVFIQKNTPELRQKLEELGYKLCECTKMCDDSWLFTIECGKVHVIPKIGRGDFMNEVTSGKDEIIYCGENEYLFIALAAMRNDTDNGQIFTNGTDWAVYKDETDKGGFSGFEYYYLPRDVNAELHKATKEEIIQLFKKNG